LFLLSGFGNNVIAAMIVKLVHGGSRLGGTINFEVRAIQYFFFSSIKITTPMSNMDGLFRCALL